MLIKKITNIILAPIYGAVLFLLVYSVIIGAYMQALAFIGLITLLSYMHNRLNDLYNHISELIK